MGKISIHLPPVTAMPFAFDAVTRILRIVLRHTVSGGFDMYCDDAVGLSEGQSRRRGQHSLRGHT